MNIRYFVALLMVILAVTSCKSAKVEDSYPKSEEEVRDERYGSLTGKGGWVIFGGKKRSEDSDAITVNGYLWRAALEVIRFMPLASTDPIGGVIITDWYVDHRAPNERFKLTVVINTTALRADGVTVNVFRQVKSGSGWQDAKVDKSMAIDLEDKIIAQARVLRAAHKH